MNNETKSKGTSAEKSKAVRGAAIAEMYSKYGILAILALVFIVGSIITPRFLSLDNILSVFNQVAVVAVLACGTTMIIISGNADLQAGSAIALLSCVCAVVMRDVGNPILAVIVTIIVGMVLYAVSGYLISYRGLPAFIVTLAAQMVLRGAAYLVANGAPILGVGGVAQLAQGKLLGIPLLLVMTILIMCIVWFVLSNTVFGRYIYAIGGNREAAAASGINVKRTNFLVYVAAGSICGLAGVLYAARTNSGLPAGAMAYEFDAIIACVLGGVSMAGGVGTVVASIGGALVVGVINNCMNLFGVNAYYQQIVKGVIIVIAIMIDKKTRDTIMKA